MHVSRLSIACISLLAFASGCSRGSAEKKVVLYPVVDERGLITYVTMDPSITQAKEDDRIAQARQHEFDEDDRQQRREAGLQEVARYRQGQRDEAEQKLQRLREQSEQDAQDRMNRRSTPPSVSRTPSGGVSESAYWERQSRAVDDSLRALRRAQEEYSRRPPR